MADLAQEFEIIDFGVEFLVALVELVDVVGSAEGGFGTRGAVERSVQARGGTQELEDFLGNAVHVDGERYAAEADERDAKLFLAQGRPRIHAVRRRSAIWAGKRL